MSDNLKMGFFTATGFSLGLTELSLKEVSQRDSWSARDTTSGQRAAVILDKFLMERDTERVFSNVRRVKSTMATGSTARDMGKGK